MRRAPGYTFKVIQRFVLFGEEFLKTESLRLQGMTVRFFWLRRMYEGRLSRLPLWI